MLLFRLRQGISAGCHHANPTPQLFSDLSVWVKRHYVSASTWTVYLFRVNYGNPTAKKFFDLSLLWEGALRFGFDLANVFPQGAKHATPAQFFWICH